MGCHFEFTITKRLWLLLCCGCALAMLGLRHLGRQIDAEIRAENKGM